MASSGSRLCCLVTGASRGIGAAIAHRLASGGHRVAVHAGVFEAHPIDATDYAQWQRA